MELNSRTLNRNGSCKKKGGEGFSNEKENYKVRRVVIVCANLKIMAQQASQQ
jgi:hypothetical protein